jgi:hypothetical protein
VLGNTTCAVAAYRIAKEGGAVVTLPWEEGFVLPWEKQEEEEDTSASLSSRGDEEGVAVAVAGAAAAGAMIASGSGEAEVNNEAGVSGDDVSDDGGGGGGGLVGWEDLSSAWAVDSDAVLLLKLAAASTAVSAAVKWGELEVDFPFEPSVWLAFSLVFGPTILNCVKWGQISKEEEEEDAAAAR